MLHSACVNVMPTARTLPLCAVAGKYRIMSNRESKIAIFKAALCYGFAIALRALFLVIRRCDFSRTHCVIASKQSERGNQRAKNPNTVACFRQVLTMTKIGGATLVAHINHQKRKLEDKVKPNHSRNVHLVRLVVYVGGLYFLQKRLRDSPRKFELKIGRKFHSKPTLDSKINSIDRSRSANKSSFK